MPLKQLRRVLLRGGYTLLTGPVPPTPAPPPDCVVGEYRQPGAPPVGAVLVVGLHTDDAAALAAAMGGNPMVHEGQLFEQYERGPYVRTRTLEATVFFRDEGGISVPYFTIAGQPFGFVFA